MILPTNALSSNDSVFERLLRLEGVQLGAGATEAELSEAEKKLQLTFSGGYRAFLIRFGWMRFQREEVFGLGADVPPELDLVSVTQRERTRAPPQLRREFTPVKYDGWGNFLCLAPLRPHEKEARVVLWEKEEGAQQVPEELAGSFGAFLSAVLDEIQEEVAASS
ncbi:MAG: SMI1/KNR4 family protein [Myxococcaceae bacterium]